MIEVIQEFKESIGQSAEEIIANGLGLQRVGNKYRCPNTHAHKNGDRNPSMSWDPNALQFHCFGCLTNIDIYEYYKEYLNYNHNEIVKDFKNNTVNAERGIQTRRNTFEQGVEQLKPVTTKGIEYIKSRGLDAETIRYFNIQSYKNDLAFPYYKYGVMVGIKTRKPQKHNSETDGEKMKSVTGSKPFLFNSQNVDFGKPLIICEGEFDCMVLHQCGFENSVSIGAGANSLVSLFEQSKEFLNRFDSMIVASDNDSSGDNMDNLFLLEFGDKVKLVDKKIYQYNDLNEELLLCGKEKIQSLINSAKLKIEGMRDLEEQPYTGLESVGRRYISTGIDKLDDAINELGTGMVTLVAGRSNGGKTTFCTQVKVNAIDKGFKVLEVSGEGLTDIMLNKFYKAVIGGDESCYDVKKINRKYITEPKKETLEALREWHKGKYKMFNKGESKLKTLDQLFSVIEAEVKENKHDLVILDNLMSLLSVQKSSEKLDKQAEFVQRCCDFAKMFNCHIIIVLHPNKTYRKGQEMDFEQIAGTSDISNKADNIIAIVRNTEEEYQESGVSGRIELLKNRYYSSLPKINTKFCKKTETILELDENMEATQYDINWRRFKKTKINNYNGTEQSVNLNDNPF